MHQKKLFLCAKEDKFYFGGIRFQILKLLVARPLCVDLHHFGVDPRTVLGPPKHDAELRIPPQVNPQEISIRTKYTPPWCSGGQVTSLPLWLLCLQHPKFDVF